MHCSVCGGADHNKKGHYKHVNQPPTEEAPGESEEEYDDPSIIAEKFTYPAPMDFGPLPESSFIANARDTIPIGRVTTAMSRGRVRGGTSGSNATRGGRSARNATRGGRSGTNARRGGRSASNATRGGRIVSNATRGGTAPSATRGGNYPSGSNPPRGARAAAPGFYNLLFGNDGQSSQQPPLFMQGEEEVLVSQNAPQDGLFGDGWPQDMHDFLSL
ncbi:rRNA 2'-O-methyltransferase fibrillarin-like [Triticum dicoccoides]|uniref:rRNA 2'-O-methyltransferase fibrillarin-like n=1 Tax=Triticum dicoccoides TaxID=85692 RepID=UPI0018914B29|nr:rRNA 2'-O-methyltransferase fibrillarin-like [Triticum dicoccoides]